MYLIQAIVLVVLGLIFWHEGMYVGAGCMGAAALLSAGLWLRTRKKAPEPVRSAAASERAAVDAEQPEENLRVG